MFMSYHLLLLLKRVSTLYNVLKWIPSKALITGGVINDQLIYNRNKTKPLTFVMHKINSAILQYPCSIFYCFTFTLRTKLVCYFTYSLPCFYFLYKKRPEYRHSQINSFLFIVGKKNAFQLKAIISIIKTNSNYNL